MFGLGVCLSEMWCDEYLHFIVNFISSKNLLYNPSIILLITLTYSDSYTVIEWVKLRERSIKGKEYDELIIERVWRTRDVK